MEEKIFKLNEIENIITKKTEEVLNIQKKNYPLDNRHFLPKDDYIKVINIDKEIENLYQNYLNIYNSLDDESKKNYVFKNLVGVHYQLTQNNNSLELANVKDEQSVQNSCNIAYQFGKDAITSLVEAQKNGNKDTIDKNRKILIACESILNQHNYGKFFKDKLMRYEKRIISGRAVHNDITDYNKLVGDAKELAKSYAQAIQRGASQEELNKYYQLFEKFFKKEEELLEFVPNELIGDNKVNLQMLKVDAEHNPENLYNTNFKRL